MTQTITETYIRDAVEHSAGEEDEEEEDIAIQRDFLIPADCDSRLKPYGGRLLADQVLTDEFYDRKDFALSLGGITLRSRDGDWELSLEERKGEDDKTANRILRDVREIGEFLHSKSLIKERGLGDDAKEALRREGFEIFANSSVTRKVYGIPGSLHGGAGGGDGETLFPAKISFDVSDLGYSVGEIEVSVDHRDEIRAALRTIDVLSQRLGFKSMSELG